MEKLAVELKHRQSETNKQTKQTKLQPHAVNDKKLYLAQLLRGCLSSKGKQADAMQNAKNEKSGSPKCPWFTQELVYQMCC